jgi:hypothetical protein
MQALSLGWWENKILHHKLRTFSVFYPVLSSSLTGRRVGPRPRSKNNLKKNCRRLDREDDFSSQWEKVGKSGAGEVRFLQPL